MKKNLLLTLTVFVLFLLPCIMLAQAPNLGTTASYALFTGAGAFSNTSASTVVTGNVGTNAGAFTAFPPGTLVGQQHVADPGSAQAAIDVANAYADLSAVNCGPVLTTTLGNGQSLAPNVYCLGAASTLNGNLTLDGGGDPNALFIFKIDGALATNTLSTVTLINGASLCNVYWQINGEVDLGDGSLFQGTIVASGAIHLLGNSSLIGRGLTTAGAISLANNIVTVASQASASTITASGAISFCQGGNVTLSGNTNGGTWSTGATTPTINVTSSGDYSVTNTSNCGNAVSNHIIVTVNPLPAADAGSNADICNGTGVSIGSAPITGHTYVWTPATGLSSSTIANPVANPTSTTTYTLTETITATGCQNSNTVTVTVNQLPVTPVITAGGSTSFCSGGSVTLSGNTDGGTWSTGATTASITVTAPGNYSVTNTNGCGSATSNVIVVSLSQPPATPVITAGGPVSFCSGGSVILSGNTGGGTWSTGATTPTITVTAPGSYSVTNTNTCGSATSNVIVVTLSQPPATPVISANGPIAFCSGGSVILSGNTGGGTWSTGATTTSITVTAPGSYSVTNTNACGSITSNIIVVTFSQSPVKPVITANGPLTFCTGGSVILSGNTGGGTWSTGATTPTITVTAAGTYSLTITNACGSASSNVIVTVNPPPTATTGNNVTICSGKSVTIGSAAITGHTYSWSPSTGLSSSTISNPVASPTGTTTYTLTETITATGCKKTNSVTVTVSPAPVSTITGGTSTCQGTPVSLCAPAGCTTYYWSTGATTRCITASTAGTYTVTVSNAAGCTSSSSITITTGIPPTATTGGNATICSGKSVTLGTVAIAGHTYSWSPSTGLSSSTISNPVASPTVTTTYTLTETITATGCQKSNSVTITVTAGPVSTITGGTSICQGTPVSLCAPAGCTTYRWSTGATTRCITVSAAGTYTVTVSNAAGCTSSSSVTIKTGTPPTATTGNGVTICNGKSVTLGSAAIAGHTYYWTPAAGLSSTTISNPVASPSVTTTYTLTETITATGCQKSNSVTITVSASPSCLISGNTTICQGQTTQLCAPAGCSSYLWSTGAKTSCIAVSAAGNYSVTVSNGTGCSSTCSKTVTITQPVTCNITGNSYCTKTKPTQLCAPSGCSSYQWSTGAKTSCITVSTGGTYSCTVTNAGGCSSYGTKKISVTSLTDNTMATSSDSLTFEPATTKATDTVQATVMTAEAYPNPSESFFTLMIHSNSKADATVTVFDVLGHVVVQLHGPIDTPIHFGNQLGHGMYYVEVVQGNQRKLLKVIKI